MRFIAAGLLVLASWTVSAAPLPLEWSWPTTRADGSPQPASGPGAFESVRIEYGTCKDGNGDAFGVKEGEIVVAYPATSAAPDVSSGIKCARAYTKDNLGILSGPSNLGRYFPAPAPVILKTTTKIAYELRPSGSAFAFVQVGTVPLGAKCGGKLAGPYAEIQGARITKPLKGGVLAAKCS